MLLDDNIFDKSYEKMWKDKKIFPMIKSSLNLINTGMKGYDFDEITMFDKFGIDISEIGFLDKRTLMVFPLLTCFQKSEGKLSDGSLNYGYNINEMYEEYDGLIYFPTKNLFISTFNPFRNETRFDRLTRSINTFTFLKKEEVEDYLLEKQWSEHIDTTINQLNYDTEHLVDNNKEYIRSYNKNLKDISYKKVMAKALEETKHNIKKKIIGEIELIKKNPFIKNVKLSDSLLLDYGDVYITDEVVTDFDEDSKPIIKKEKVYIGNMQFVIKGKDIKLINNHCVENHSHPHCNSSGNLCFGDNKLLVDELLSLFSLNKLCNYFYSWLTSYNKDDCNCSLNSFYKEHNKKGLVKNVEETKDDEDEQ